MTPGGWIVMLLSVGGVTALLVFCIWKVLSTPGETGRIHGFEMETPDERTEHERQD